MNNSEFIKKVSAKASVNQERAKSIIDAAISVIKDTVKSGEDVHIHSLGKFSKKVIAAHVGVHPATKEKINIPETSVVAFKSAKEFKCYINS